MIERPRDFARADQMPIAEPETNALLAPTKFQQTSSPFAYLLPADIVSET
jgi:hypothetical protein